MVTYQFPARMQLHDAFLSGMASILEAEYSAGDLAAELDRLRGQEQVRWRHWFMKGRHGTFRVRLELGETHLHCLLEASAPQVYAGKELMLQQASTRQDYRLPLRPDEEFLSRMASLLEAEYRAGEYERVLEAVHEAEGVDDRTWALEGPYGKFLVFIERGESYRSCVLMAQEPQLAAGKQLMRERYLAGGGDPGRLKP